MIRTANTGHATKQHSLVRSFLDCYSPEHCAFLFDCNQPRCIQTQPDALFLDS
jgi:hypothetical protein